MTYDPASRLHRNLLLYIETVAVDKSGLIDDRRINTEERELLGEWDTSRFIDLTFGYVRLSEEAWKESHVARRARAERALARLSAQPEE